MAYVSDFMSRDAVTIDSAKSALEAAGMMSSSKLSCLVVIDQNRPVGIVTERDFLWRLTSKNKVPEKVKVSEIMSQPLVTIEPKASLKDAIRMMRENDIRRLVVFDNSKLLGVITLTDISKFLL